LGVGEKNSISKREGYSRGYPLRRPEYGVVFHVDLLGIGGNSGKPVPDDCCHGSSPDSVLCIFSWFGTIRSRGLLGALLTVVGIAIAVGGAQGANLSFWRVLAIIGGSACFAEAGVVAKLFPCSHPIVTNAVAISVGALILACFLCWLK